MSSNIGTDRAFFFLRRSEEEENVTFIKMQYLRVRKAVRGCVRLCEAVRDCVSLCEDVWCIP